jgi:glycosyltransferase involved in cell wall biosynthesis
VQREAMTGEVPRTLLLNFGPVEIRNAGEVFLRTLASHYPKDRLCRFVLMPADSSWKSNEWLGFPICSMPSVRQAPYRRFGESLGKATSFVSSEYARLVHARTIVDRAVAFGRTHGVQQVWAVLNHPQVIYAARYVAARLDVPLVVLVWDPPERLADALRVDSLTRSRIVDEFDRTIVLAERVGVASAAMREEYLRKYGIGSGVLIQGVDRSWLRPPAREYADSQSFTIGFAGSLYAFAEFEALISALTLGDWRIDGREVTLRILGHSVQLESDVGVRIEWLGWRSQLDTIDALSRADLCYVPYWFNEAYRVPARLCFPNKIATYLAAGRPLFVHAPRGTSPVLFTEKYGLGLCCNSLDPGLILASLSELLTDPAEYGIMAQASAAAIEAELSMTVFIERFAQLMGVDVGQLVPVGSPVLDGII